MKFTFHFILSILISSISFYFYLLNQKENNNNLSLINSNYNSILWLIAHPDDESLFFAPSILNLLEEDNNNNSNNDSTKRRRQGHLLSLSSGNHEGIGKIRAKELLLSCNVLGIKSQFCEALDHSELQDNPNVWWNETLIRSIVSEYIKRWEIDLIITFDEYGVSGHSNHKALSAAFSSSNKEDSTLDSFPPVFAVLSTNLLAKYTSLLSLPFTYYQHSYHRRRCLSFSLFPNSLKSSNEVESKEEEEEASTSLFLSSPRQYLKARESFEMHKSQKRWFRSLFMYFSRYLWFVELVRI